VHIAAWQSYGVDGKVWETLTFLWQGEAATGAELAEQISQYRHYDEADYTTAFEELASHGWAIADNDRYLITEKGKKVRQEAEDDTDQLFYAPFKELDQKEIEELKTLLEKLAEVVKSPETEAEPT
jgi:DNA-binding MarR family transcriptional regulator